jgi:heme-degrading monooxygenase HmoA
MFAIVNHLHFNKPVEDFREDLLKEGLPILSKNEGFIDFHFIKVEEFKAIVIILWKDASSAQAGAKSFGPTWFASNFKPYIVGGENRFVGEVLVSFEKK